MKKSKIGKCKYYPIPKAGLIFFYEYRDCLGSIDWGDLNAIHKIVDIAGGEHCSVDTGRQVLSRLRSSPFWESKKVRGMYSGIGNGTASLFEPSDEGRRYYESHLKNRKTDLA